MLNVDAYKRIRDRKIRADVARFRYVPSRRVEHTRSIILCQRFGLPWIYTKIYEYEYLPPVVPETWNKNGKQSIYYYNSYSPAEECFPNLNTNLRCSDISRFVVRWNFGFETRCDFCTPKIVICGRRDQRRWGDGTQYWTCTYII